MVSLASMNLALRNLPDVRILKRNVLTSSFDRQAKAERGSGNSHLMPLIILAISFLVLGYTWFQLPILIQSSILWLGWPLLYVVTIAQTVVMVGKLFRRQRGYKV